MITKKIDIFQITNIGDVDYAFRDFDEKKFSTSHYHHVHTLCKDFEDRVIDEDFLDEIYLALNTSGYKEKIQFKGHSLSVSDVIVVDDVRAWYVDGIGFKNISNFWFGGNKNA